MDKTSEQVRDEYLGLCHAMQSGVAMDMAHGLEDTSPKHLRVGINTAKCDHAALVRLLIDKGILTDGDYLTAIRDEMRREVSRYEAEISERVGAKVTLG